MVRSQATTMKSRNKNGRTHAAFNAFDTPLSRFSSATSRSLMIVFSGEKLTRWINTGKRVFVRQFGPLDAKNGHSVAHHGMQTAAAHSVGSLPPCGGGLGRGVSQAHRR